MVDNSQSIEHLDKTNQVNLIYNSIINNKNYKINLKLIHFHLEKI